MEFWKDSLKERMKEGSKSGLKNILRGDVGHMDILAVDDNKINRKILEIFLIKLGYTFDIATGGQEALELFGRNKYKLVLLDLNMPHLNGMEVCKIIHAVDPDLPVIALTAAGNCHKAECLKMGFYDFYIKPILFEEMKEILKSILVEKVNEVNSF